MMDTINLREQLHAYINKADTKKLKAIYTILENEIHPPTPNWPKDWLLEIEQRTIDLDSKKATSITLKEFLTDAKSHLVRENE